MRRLVLMWLVYFTALNLSAQSIDSLKKKLYVYSNAKKIQDLVQLANFFYNNSQPDSATFYITQADSLSRDIHDNNLFAKILIIKARLAYDKSNFARTVSLCDSALDQATDTSEINEAKLLLADTYSEIGLFQESYQIYRQLIDYYKKKHDTLTLSKLYSNIGNLFFNADMLDSALYYSRHVIYLDSLLHDTSYLVIDYSNMAASFQDTVHPDSVYFYIQKALKYAKEIGNPYFLGSIYLNLGSSEMDQKKYKLALKHHLLSVDYFRQAKLYSEVSQAFLNIVEDYLFLSKIDSARVYYDSAKSYMQRISQLPVDLKSLFYQTSIDFYSRLREYQKAFEYLKKYYAFKDSIQLSQQKRQLMLYDIKNEIIHNKLKLEIRKGKTKQLELWKKFYKTTSVISLTFLVIVLILIIFLSIAYRRLRKSARQDAILAILYEIRSLSAQHDPSQASLNELLEKILEKIISIKHLPLLPVGMIFLLDEKGNLRLAAYKNIGNLKEKCQIIKPGQCHCGLSFSLNEIIVLKKDDIADGLKEPHGHYIAPLVSDNKTIGVLNLYLKPGRQLSSYIAKLLENLAYEIASITVKYQQQQKLAQTLKKQNELNQKLFALALKLKTKNNELDEAYKKLGETYHELDEQSSILKETLDGLQDSIILTSYLIKSFLPSEQRLTELLGDNYFIIYKPRDIIGGDFYFVEKINNILFLMVGDATGHGIPGALLATQTVTLIRHILFEEHILQPAQILTHLRNKIKELFTETEVNFIKNFGVDLAICSVNISAKTLTTASAFLPITVIHDNNLTIIRPTRNPIGKYLNEKEFTQETMKIYADDMIYLQSDGYNDQFNESWQRFRRKKYKELLLEIHKLSPQKQKQIMLKTIEEWKGKQFQTDDITVMGVRVFLDKDNTKSEN